jgi:hypothetical protein
VAAAPGARNVHIAMRVGLTTRRELANHIACAPTRATWDVETAFTTAAAGRTGERRPMFDMASFTSQEIAAAKAAFCRGSKGRVSFIGMARGEGNRLRVAAQILDRGRPLWMRLVNGIYVGESLAMRISDPIAAGRLRRSRPRAGWIDPIRPELPLPPGVAR